MTIVERPPTEGANQFRIQRSGDGRFTKGLRGRSALAKNLLHKTASQRVLKHPQRKSLK